MGDNPSHSGNTGGNGKSDSGDAPNMNSRPEESSDVNMGGESNMEERRPPQAVLGKRKRADGGDDAAEDSLFFPDENDMVPESSILIDDDDDDVDTQEVRVDEEESDDDMEEDGDKGTQTAYDPTSESLPRCPIYDGDMAQIKDEFAAISLKVFNLLQQPDCNSGHVKTQRDAAERLMSIPSPERLRVALLGDAGAGKSSVLNSVTDMPDLAKSLSGGQSCTCVPTRYSGAFRNQRKDFAARIFYFSIDEIRGHLEELIQDYSIFAFEMDEEWDEDTVTAFKRKMQNAQKTFLTVFCDLPGFQDQKAVRNTLEAAYDYEDGRTMLLDTMLESAEKKLKHKVTEEGYSEYREATTRAKLRDVLDPLITSRTVSDQPSLWPLVKLVCIGVRGSRVLENLAILDLPGISDTNETRVNLTKKYVKGCDYLWVVANISRVVDDGMVDHLLSKYGKLFKGKVAVICTHSDDGVDNKLARHLQEDGQDVSEYRQLSEKFKGQKTAVTQLKATIKKRRARKSNTKPQLLEIQKQEDELRAMRAEWVMIDNSEFGAIVKARNAFVTAQLQNEMEFHLPVGTDLNVFCVSNPHYAAAKGLSSTRGPKLAPDITGIPALRGFALTIPAAKMLETVDDYIKDSMMVFLKDLALWVNQSTVERRQDLMELVKQPQKMLPRCASDRGKEYRQKLETIFTIPMRDQQTDAIEGALRVYAQKELKHAATKRAFIRKNGLHSTKLCPKESWNEQFSKVSIDFVADSWSELETELEDMDAKLEADSIENLQTVIQRLREHPCATMLPMERLAELIDAHAVSLQVAFRKQHEKNEHNLRNHQLDITQHSDMNYFSNSMQPVYDACNEDSGKGVTRRSMDMLKAHLEKTTPQSPFAVMERKATVALKKNDEKHVTALEKAIGNVFQRAFQSFDRTIDRKMEDPTETPVRDRIKQALAGINRDYAEACTKLDEIKDKYLET